MSSKGEQKIANILRRNGVKFKQEYSFPDLVGFKNTPLRFDFAIFRNNRLFCLLDYDGSQHFTYTSYFYKTIFDFRKAQEWDRRKNAYCLRKGIMFLRVPYWDYNTLTFKKLFSTPSYIVRNKYHNDLLEVRKG